MQKDKIQKNKIQVELNKTWQNKNATKYTAGMSKMRIGQLQPQPKTVKNDYNHNIT